VSTPDATRATQVLGRAVDHVNGHRLLVRAADPATVNARLVGEGVPVSELGPERRSLEQVIEERTLARQPGEVAR
jgi:hypothetical protein